MTTICQTGDPVLRQAARPLSPDEILSAQCRQLIEHMQATVRSAPGVGLAAPQIGVGMQIAVIEDRPEYIARWSPEQIEAFERVPVPFYVIINPELELLEPDDTALFYEGCLSVAGFSALVPRAKKVRVKYLDESARPQVIEASGWHARILQHEIDHLNGTLYLDRMLTRSFTSVESLHRHWIDKAIPEICQALNI